MMEVLDGKKTYTIAITAILSAIYAYYSGGLSFVEAAQIALTGGVAATLRHAIAKATGSQEIADTVVDIVEDVVEDEIEKQG